MLGPSTRSKVFKPIETYKNKIKTYNNTMKQKPNTGLSMLILVTLLASIPALSGCVQKFNTNTTINPEPEAEINPITGKPYQDIHEKRGVITNITAFDELLRRASAIESFRYKLTDTELEAPDQEFIVRGRFVKIKLEQPQYHDDGTIFDEVLIDKLTEKALAHCSKTLCKNPTDKEVEHVEYSDYIQMDPVEYIYQITNAEYADQEILDKQYTKVFNAKFEGKDARVWLQEYYGFPLKIIVRNQDNSRRTIEFKDLMINEVRSGELQPPFNFTVRGEGTKTWWTWEHYNGEWKNKAQIPEEFQMKIQSV